MSGLSLTDDRINKIRSNQTLTFFGLLLIMLDDRPALETTQTIYENTKLSGPLSRKMVVA